MSELLDEAVAEIELPGLFSTVQDRGRFGSRRYGIPSSGAIDMRSYTLANQLLGNMPDAPAIEVIGGNFSIIFKKRTRMAVTGARCRASLNDAEAALDKVLEADAGSRLLLSVPDYGFVNYVAIEGGFWGELVLGSRSTYMPAHFGGSWGRLLRKGDSLPGLDMHRGVADSYARSEFELRDRIFVRQAFHTNEAIMSWLTSQKFTVEPESDRMGFRLLPEMQLQSSLYREIVTIPVFPGMVQLTRSGELVIVNKDGQTTGGYPVIAMMDES
ncbi:MAG: biotin-dependent carboxyltransferase family protein [Conexivisphaerales archaeon]